MRRYLACGQRREKGGTGFPTHDRTGTSRFLTRDQRVVFSSDAAHHKCRPSQSNPSIRFRLFCSSFRLSYYHLHKQIRVREIAYQIYKLYFTQYLIGLWSFISICFYQQQKNPLFFILLSQRSPLSHLTMAAFKMAAANSQYVYISY